MELVGNEPGIKTNSREKQLAWLSVQNLKKKQSAYQHIYRSLISTLYHICLFTLKEM